MVGRGGRVRLGFGGSFCRVSNVLPAANERDRTGQKGHSRGGVRERSHSGYAPPGPIGEENLGRRQREETGGSSVPPGVVGPAMSGCTPDGRQPPLPERDQGLSR